MDGKNFSGKIKNKIKKVIKVMDSIFLNQIKNNQMIGIEKKIGMLIFLEITIKTKMETKVNK